MLSDSKVYFSLLRKLSSTSSDGVRSGNLDARLPPCGIFLDDACVAFSRNLVFISLHRHSFCRYAACLMKEGAESLAKLLVELEPFNSVV